MSDTLTYEPKHEETQFLLDLGHGVALWRVHIDELIEQEVNARAMTKPAFDRLTATVARDQRLESLPLVALTERGLEIVSGHHRTRAARSAGVEVVYALVDTTGLSPGQIKAKQLAHNAIEGYDDPQLVAVLYGAIDDVEARMESFIDPADVGIEVPSVALPPLDLGLDYRTVLLTFLPTQLERFDEAAEAVSAELSKDNDETWVAHLDLLPRWREVMRRVGKDYDVRMMGAVLDRIAAIVLAYLGDDPFAEDEEVVALRDLFGTAVIPKEAAEIIQHAVTRLEKAGDISPKARWRAIELLAADFISGA